MVCDRLGIKSNFAICLLNVLQYRISTMSCRIFNELISEYPAHSCNLTWLYTVGWLLDISKIDTEQFQKGKVDTGQGH